MRYRYSGKDERTLDRSLKLDHKSFHGNLVTLCFIFWGTAVSHLVLSRKRNKVELGYSTGHRGRKWMRELNVEMVPLISGGCEPTYEEPPGL